MFFNVKPDRFSSCRGTRFLSSPEPTPRERNRTPNRMIRSVATSQTIVDATIRKPSALFRFSSPNASIHSQNGFHFNRYRNPHYARNTMAMRQTIWTKSGVFATGPLRRSHIASAAAKRKGQEDMQLSLESIYSVQRALPSHWEWRHADLQHPCYYSRLYRCSVGLWAISAFCCRWYIWVSSRINSISSRSSCTLGVAAVA